MDAFVALADSTRRQIIESLLDGERSFGELAARFEMSRPAVSQHLKILKQTGLVAVRAQAQRRYYRLNHEGFEECTAWLQKVRRFRGEHLDKLDAALRENKTKRRRT